MSRLLVLGAGGHGAVMADAASQTKHWTEVALLDDDYPSLKHRASFPVIGKLSDLGQLARSGDQYIVAIGDAETRLARHAAAKKSDCDPTTVTHPFSYVSNTVTIGLGACIFAGAVVQPETLVGECVIVNTRASIDHDCTIGDGVHICPGVNLGGNVTVGRGSWVGIGASIKHGVTIGAGVTVGAGAVVIDDVPDGVTVKGVPAR